MHVKLRELTFLDQLLTSFDNGLRTLFGTPQATGRASPAVGIAECDLDHTERIKSASLMRVNHSGEVCAQALYQGQALTARNTSIRIAMSNASKEENDHLLWCQHRIKELGGHASYLNPLWYCGSFTIGLVAGMIGDKWSLGFLAETERQVVEHLDGHLKVISERDVPSRVILEQMKIDEAGHATQAVSAGAAELPNGVKRLMRVSSQMMTTTAYWI